MLPAVISCFDRTTNMVKPWAEAGFLCYCVDTHHEAGEHIKGNIVKVGADMLDWLPPLENIAISFFSPPCTNVAVSGARWFRDKGIGALINALQLFEISIKIAEWTRKPYIIENPVSTISSYWRKPDYIFQPWEYGDLYSKKTCLWGGNGFIMPKAIHKEKPLGVTEKIWKMAPSADRSDKRSESPMGFANAVFEANHRQALCTKMEVNGGD